MKAIAKYSLGELAAFCGVACDADVRVSGVSTDTRTLMPGDLFVALSGPNFDANAFASVAVERGASAVLVSKGVDVDVPVLRVDDTLRALQDIATAVFARLKASGVVSVALTGSNGKTTTKELVAALIGSAGKRVHATPGNLNNHIGVPLTILATPADAEVMVVEMGCNRFRDISELVKMAPCDVRVVTSIGYAHVEILGDLDGVRVAKSEIFEQADAQTVAVVPFDERDRLKLRGFPGRIFTSGLARGADAVVAATPEAGRQRVRLDFGDHDISLGLPLPGVHNAENLGLAWLAVSRGLGLSLEQGAAQNAMDRFALPGGRLKRVEAGPWHIIDDAYNANPTSARASYEAFLELDGPAPRIAVLGEMKELGERAEALHAELARAVAARGGADHLVFVGPFAETMAEAARSVSPDATVFGTESLETAATHLKQIGPGFVFFKASRGARLERLIDTILGKTA